jgi:hypothetical protein
VSSRLTAAFLAPPPPVQTLKPNLQTLPSNESTKKRLIEQFLMGVKCIDEPIRGVITHQHFIPAQCVIGPGTSAGIPKYGVLTPS